MEVDTNEGALKGAIAANHDAELRERYGDLKALDFGRSALVVGVTPDNIGAAIAARLVRSGRFGDRFGPASTDVEDNGRVKTVNKDTLDLSDMRQVEDFDWRSFDTLVLANGFSRLNWLEDASIGEIYRSVEDNLIGSMLATRAFVRATINAPWVKHVVIVGSMAHRSILNGSSYYCATKAGLAHFTRCAAWELTPKAYRVFSVHPSNTEGTPMTEETIAGIERYRGISRDAAEAYWGAINLMPRWLQAGDIAELVAWLVTNEAAQYLVGSDIELKAGQR